MLRYLILSAALGYAAMLVDGMMPTKTAPVPGMPKTTTTTTTSTDSTTTTTTATTAEPALNYKPVSVIYDWQLKN